MPASWRLEFEDRPLQEVVTRLGERFQRRDYFARVAERWKEWIRQNFLAGGTEQSWPALDPDTVAGKTRGGATLAGRGALARSLFNPAVTITENTVTVRPRAPHAHLHHLGTRPNVITPKSQEALTLRFQKRVQRGRAVGAAPVARRFLVFRTAKGLVFARTVHHPGLRPRRLMPTLATAQAMATDALNDYLSEAIRDAEMG